MLVSGELRRKIRLPSGEWFEGGCLFGTFISTIDPNPAGDIRVRASRNPLVREWLESCGLTANESVLAEQLSEGYGRVIKARGLDVTMAPGLYRIDVGDNGYSMSEYYFDISPGSPAYTETWWRTSEAMNDFVTCRLRYDYVVHNLTEWSR